MNIQSFVSPVLGSYPPIFANLQNGQNYVIENKEDIIFRKTFLFL